MTFMNFISMFCIVVGIVCSTNGYLIWKKQYTKFLNKSNFSRVKADDMPMYCKRVGQGNILIGLSTIFIGVFFNYSESVIGMIIYFAMFGLGSTIGIRAQMKYNGSIV